MNKNRPFIITFIGDISFLGALLSIVISLFPSFSERFGISTIPLPLFSAGIMQVLLPLILLIASYGFLRLKRWGYWTMITYSTFFLLVYIIWCLQNKHLFLSTNFMLTFMELIFILPTKKYFYEEKFPS
jgi:DMSO/TMAO reductase YedYZ heme-binding membrane subunit